MESSWSSDPIKLGMLVVLSSTGVFRLICLQSQSELNEFGSGVWNCVVLHIELAVEVDW